jgi:hypothetical protein
MNANLKQNTEVVVSDNIPYVDFYTSGAWNELRECFKIVLQLFYNEN